MTTGSDIPFGVPLYTCAEAARCLDVPDTTFRAWVREGLVSSLPAEVRGGPCIPFFGLAEGMVLSALRRAAVPPRQIRPALELVGARIGVAHPLASRKFREVGARLLWDVSAENDGAQARHRARGMVVRQDGRYVFRSMIERHLQRISYGETHARRLLLPGYEVADIAVDPEINFGRPYFTHTGTPVFAVTRLLKAGETIADIADDFGLPADQLTEVAWRLLPQVAA